MLSGMNANHLIVGDCLDVLPTLPAGCAALVYADPPFNLGLKYNGYMDRLPREVYLSRLGEWLAAVARVLSPTGTLFVQIHPRWAGYVQVALDGLGLHYRGTPIWAYNFGPHNPKNFGVNHQHLLYYTAHKGRFTFNADAVRVPSARMKCGDKRADPRGRVPGDVWEFPRVCGTFKRRAGHVCQTPDEVLERVVLACSNPGELVLDPFAGSGTTLVAAARLGRRYLGVEVSEETAELARGRLAGIGVSA